MKLAFPGASGAAFLLGLAGHASPAWSQQTPSATETQPVRDDAVAEGGRHRFLHPRHTAGCRTPRRGLFAGSAGKTGSADRSRIRQEPDDLGPDYRRVLLLRRPGAHGLRHLQPAQPGLGQDADPAERPTHRSEHLEYSIDRAGTHRDPQRRCSGDLWRRCHRWRRQLHHARTVHRHRGEFAVQDD